MARTLSKFHRSRGAVFSLYVHLIFTCKYRHKVISNRAFRILHQAFEEECKKLGVILRECNGSEDHMHLLVEYPPTLSISHLVLHLKSASSRKVRKAALPEVKSKLWGRAFWSPSYFAASCGGVTIDVLRAYIENQ